MEFKQAIKQIVQENGVEILSERRIISIISDLKAFCDSMSYAKKMLIQIYQDGYGEKIYKAYVAKDITQVNAIKKSIVETYGFDDKKVSQIFDAFTNAVGLKEPIRMVLKKKTEKQPTRTPQSTRTRQEPSVDDLQALFEQMGKSTPSSNPAVPFYCSKIAEYKCDGYGNIIGHSYDKLYVDDVNFLALDIDIVSKLPNQECNLEIRVKTANGISDVRTDRVWLKPGSNKITTHPFGNYDGNYFGAGNTIFEVYVNNQFVRKYFVEIYSPMTFTTAVKKDTEWKVCFSIIILGLNIGLWFDIGWWIIIPAIFGIWTLVKLWKDELLNKYNIHFLIAYLVCTIALLLPLSWWITTLVIVGCVIVLAFIRR